MHPSTAVDPYLALNCAQHLAALLHGGVFFRKVSWISTKCVASSVKVGSGKLWPKKCQIWHRLSGDQVSKRVAEVSKRLHINVLYKTQSNTKYNTIWHFALNCLQLAQMPNRRQLTPSKVLHSPNTASLRPMLFTESQSIEQNIIIIAIMDRVTFPSCAGLLTFCLLSHFLCKIYVASQTYFSQ